MPKATLRHPKESFESLMRRFKKAIERSDLINELRRRETYEKPSVRRKRAKAAAVKRQERLTFENRMMVDKRLQQQYEREQEKKDKQR